MLGKVLLSKAGFDILFGFLNIFCFFPGFTLNGQGAVKIVPVKMNPKQTNKRLFQ